jgi:mono/diheme cytochrome c family protein
VIAVVTNGQGPMPSFSWLGDEDIDLIAAYVVQVKK